MGLVFSFSAPKTKKTLNITTRKPEKTTTNNAMTPKWLWVKKKTPKKNSLWPILFKTNIIFHSSFGYPVFFGRQKNQLSQNPAPTSPVPPLQPEPALCDASSREVQPLAVRRGYVCCDAKGLGKVGFRVLGFFGVPWNVLSNTVFCCLENAVFVCFLF